MAIVPGFIPAYRANFYHLLRKTSKKDYVVFYGPPPAAVGLPDFDLNPDSRNVKIKNREISFFGQRIIYQPVIARVMFSSFDAVILLHEMKSVSTIALFALCKMIGKPVIWWGQGFDKEHDRSIKFTPLAQLVAAVKKSLAGLGDMYIVYTEGGADKLMQSSVPKDKINVVRNTIDMGEQCSLYANFVNADDAKFRKDHSLKLDSKILLYIGRIYKAKRVEELLYLVRQVNSNKLCGSFVEAVIIGNGPELDRVKEIGRPIQGIHFLGEVYDQEIIAQYMRICSAVVIPGAVGLAVNHAFAHGVPVITRQHNNHGPEVEYIVSGKNGLVIDGDFASFVRETVVYLNSPDCQKRMAKAALERRNVLTLDFMVKAFDEAVSKAIKQKAKNRVRS